jgi:hypothetical protein
MDVGVWLRLGLSEYEAAFRENKIYGDILPNWTTDDLKELGVTVVGHRRKLLTALRSEDVVCRGRPEVPAPIINVEMTKGDMRTLRC